VLAAGPTFVVVLVFLAIGSCPFLAVQVTMFPSSVL